MRGAPVLLLFAFMGLVAAPGAAARPVLSVLSVSKPPPTASSGDRLPLKVSVANAGGQGVKATVRVMLRKSPAASRGWVIASEPRFVAAKDVTKMLSDARVPAMASAAWYVAACTRKRGFAGKIVCASNGHPLVVKSPAEPPGPEGPRASGVGGGPTGPTGPVGLTPDYRSGARTLGDTLFPEVGNGGYDVQHYDVELSYDPIANSFGSGTRTTIAAAATQPLSDFSLDLEGLTVAGVTVDGRLASFVREAPGACSKTVPPVATCAATKLVVTPATPIDSGDAFEVAVDYSGVPQEHVDPSGSAEGWMRSDDGAWVVGEPIGAQTWFPGNNYPTDKATYDFWITVPEDTDAADGTTMGLGNGELVGAPLTSGGRTTWHWREGLPMATYLATATVGDFDLTQSTTPAGLRLYNAIDSGYSPTTKAKILAILEREEEVMDFFAASYTPYPFHSAGAVVDDLSGISYVLESQTKIQFPRVGTVSPISLVHELAHHWWGDSVSPAEWSDVWMNEGWATWSEWDWSDSEDGGPSPAQQFDANYAPDKEWEVPTAVPKAIGLFHKFRTYTRPAMMIEAIRQIIGDAKFTELTRQWQGAHRYGNGTEAQFLDLVRQLSGFTGANLARLDEFFQEWLYGTTQPTITGENFFSS